MKQIISSLVFLLLFSFTSFAQAVSYGDLIPQWPRADNGLPLLIDGRYKITSYSIMTDNSCESHSPKEAYLYVYNYGKKIAIVADNMVVQRKFNDIFPTTVCLEEDKVDPVIVYRTKHGDGDIILWPNDNPKSNIFCLNFNFAGKSYNVNFDIGQGVACTYDDFLNKIGLSEPDINYPSGRYTIREHILGMDLDSQGYMYIDNSKGQVKIHIHYPDFEKTATSIKEYTDIEGSTYILSNSDALVIVNDKDENRLYINYLLTGSTGLRTFYCDKFSFQAIAGDPHKINIP